MPKHARGTEGVLSFDRRLAAYAAGAGAIVAAGESARATVVYSGPQSITIGTNQDYDLYFTGVGIDADLYFTQSSDLTTNSSLSVEPKQNDLIASSTMPGEPLPADVDVASQSFTTANGSTFYTLAAISTTSVPVTSGPFYGVPDEYLAVQFAPYEGSPDYGWVELSVTGGTDPSQGPTATILGWAYNDDGTSLRTGQTPEPTALALLALGATGVMMRRPRRPDQPASQ
jgi:hypothetical protein